MNDEKKKQMRKLAGRWGCNATQFDMLLFIKEQGGEITYDTPGVKGISGQAGETLRSMVRRDWLTGPDSREKIRARPFAISVVGHIFLAHLENGLRPASAMTELQWAALKSLAETGQPGPGRSRTVQSLQKWGYVDPAGEITVVGRLAYANAYTEREESDASSE